MERVRLMQRVRGALGALREVATVDLVWVPSHGKQPKREWQVPPLFTAAEAREVNDLADKEATAQQARAWAGEAADLRRRWKRYSAREEWQQKTLARAIEVHARYDEHLHSLAGVVRDDVRWPQGGPAQAGRRQETAGGAAAAAAIAAAAAAAQQ